MQNLQESLPFRAETDAEGQSEYRLLGDCVEPHEILIRKDGDLYERCAEIIASLNHRFDDREQTMNMLAVRGAYLDAAGNVRRSDSARQYAENSDPYHFWSGPERCARGRTPFEDLLLTISRVKTKRYVNVRPCCVNPGLPFDSDRTECPIGTAHLCDGQYIYKIGSHGTTSPTQIRAVLSLCFNPHDCDLLQPAWHFKDARPPVACRPDCIEDMLQKIPFYLSLDAKLRYKALNADAPVAVVREPYRSERRGILLPRDVETAEKHLRMPSMRHAYVDHAFVAINIHTCPDDGSSSQGCQNVPKSHYLPFLRELAAFEKFLYTLVDASKISAF